MKDTRFLGKVIVDELTVIGKTEAGEIVTASGTSCPGVVAKAAAPATSDKYPVGTMWVKADASAPEIYICVALTDSAATWKKLTLAT